MLSLYLYISMSFWTIVYLVVCALPATVCLLLPVSKSRTAFRHLILWYGTLIVRIAVWPWIRVTYDSTAPSDESDEGIYVFNHRSASDPFLIALLGLPMLQLVNGWPMRLPLFGFFARRCGYINTTKNNYEESRAKIAAALAAQVPIASFPEGTRSGSRNLNQFRSGIFKIAMELRAPIHPCCIVGNEYIPDRRFRFQTGRIRVRRMPVITAEEAAAFDNAYLLKQHVKTLIQAEITKLEEP
ncbi:MAG: lysophospholipid acyltransferase family protein [Lentisphaeria bacterium]|jgi:1-acyl-sn-glycerol-3-phosphate acyltransferase